MTETPTMIWLDIETTGLDPESDCILEIACVVTGPDLVPHDARRRPVMPRLAELSIGALRAMAEALPPVVREMHERSGLLADLEFDFQDYVEGADFNWLGRCDEVDAELVEWLQSFGRADGWLLAGSSVHFDRSFLRRHMPRLDAMLSHRHFDVSVLHRFAEMFAPAHVMPRESEPAHRAMPDVRHSIEVARWYRDRLGARP